MAQHVFYVRQLFWWATSCIVFSKIESLSNQTIYLWILLLITDDSIQIGLNPSHQLTEDILHQYQLPEQIGDRWRDLARAFGYSEAIIDATEKDKGSFTKECCIAILVRWMGREGRDATVGKLAEALIKIELKNLAETLMCANSSQVR